MEMLKNPVSAFIAASAVFVFLSGGSSSRPHLLKAIRFRRPYANICIFLAWLFVRFVSPAAMLDEGIVHREIGFLDFTRALLKHIQDQMEEFLATKFGTSTFASSSLVPRLSLYTNDFLGIILVVNIIRLVQCLYYSSWHEFKDGLIQSSFDFANANIPSVRKTFLKEQEKMEISLKESLWEGRMGVTKVLPKEGMDVDTLMKDLKSAAKRENGKWQNGLVSGAVYGGESKHTELLNQVYGLYSLSNPLHPDIWPRVNQCEAEVISMTAGLLNGDDDNVVGAMTSGGTESIVMAVRAHLRVYGKKKGIEFPTIISGDTAHAGLNKACEMFGIRLLQVPCGESSGYQLDPKQVERFMNSNVIMIYSSAPTYPQGVIDPIEKLSALAIKFGVGLHVDCCLGGFVLPFARMLNYDVPKFDFECLGVTSMSADTHKYGYASKGTSVVLYRNNELRRGQYFNYSKWTGGMYSTPTIAGSRAGALIACAWASLMAIGEEGFKARVKLIMDATIYIAKGVSQIEGLRLLGCDPSPHAMIVCFAPCDGVDLDIYQVAGKMSKEGWSLNSLQNPASIHLCVTLKTVEHKVQFLADLNDAVKDLLTNPVEKKEGSSAAIYGATGSLPAGPVNELLKVYTDVTLSC